MIRGRFLAVALAAAAAAGIITAIIVMQPIPPADVTIEREVQATDWGPLALAFPAFSWIGDAKGAVVDALVFVAVLIWNRRAWIVAGAGAMSGAWYVVLSHLVLRARPTTALVLRVTEHPAASSFPSGHTIFIATVTAVIMLCLGHRYLPRWGLPIGWAVAALIVFDGAISRIYTGAHWPTDVLAGLLIATAWLTLVLSLRWMSDRVFESPRPAERRRVGVAS
ncbi:MAG: phosphatase PAP2 family protein [Chloroflexi bacterium]|nr:MAG: phosphatase PAP2 family protein [Chloroflexota bacterium]